MINSTRIELSNANMNQTRYTKLLTLSFSLLLTACAAQKEAAAPAAQTEETPATEAAGAAAPINDYPTRDRVEYVLECAAKHGGLGYISQINCGCKIDKIAEQLPFVDYEAARTFGQMQKTVGEAGAMFRGQKQAKDLKTRYKEAEDAAEKACFVK